jgi:hypothetical protein
MAWKGFTVVSLALVVACESPVSPPVLLVPACSLPLIPGSSFRLGDRCR